MEPNPDPRFSNVTSLGQFRKLYKGNLLKWWLILLAALLMGCLFIVVVLGIIAEEFPQFYLLLGVILLAPLAWTIRHPYPWAVVALYEHGFACYDGKSIEQVPWTEIERVEERKGIVDEGNLPLTYTDYIIHVRAGFKIIIPDTLPGFHELWLLIQQNAVTLKT